MKGELIGVAWLLGLGSSLSLPVDRTAAEEAARQAQRPAGGARAVIGAVVRAAAANAGLPRRGEPGARPPFRREGDELTELDVRAAAAAARKLPADEAAGAFLVGVGIALDDSTVLRNNPLTARLCREAESEEGRKQRLAVLGKPTMRGRRDLAQHFVVSCTLAELAGPSLAEAAGLLKEQKDMLGTSGFSFADLATDLAGIAVAVRLKKGGVTLEALEKGYRVADFLPDPAGLREGLSAGQFAKEFGSFSDKRFVAEVDRLRRRVADLPAYRKE